MITKGIKQEAKIAVSYVLKHFYAARTPTADDNARARAFSQIYDFDLINYLHVYFQLGGSVSGATANLYIYANGIGLDSELDMTRGNHYEMFLDCTELVGEQTLELHIQSGAAGESVLLDDLTIYPLSKTLYVPL